jgi:transposase
MSNQAIAIPPIPGETARNAKAIFGRGNFYILAGEHLEAILEDIQSECLLEAGALLPQTTFFQFLESLTDSQAIEAVRTRLDWKFALHLPVYPPVFHESALCEFRQNILIDPVCQREFQVVIDRLLALNPPINDSRYQNCKNLEMVSMVCSVNRLGLIHGAMCQALEILAIRFPEWLRKTTLPHWYGRYNNTAPGFDSTASLCQQELSIREIGTDIHYLLEEVHRSVSEDVKELQEVKMLDTIWKRQFDSPDQVINDKGNLLKLKDCDFCIYKDRRSMDGKYQ